jgi:hypothetical protein
MAEISERMLITEVERHALNRPKLLNCLVQLKIARDAPRLLGFAI